MAIGKVERDAKVRLDGVLARFSLRDQQFRFLTLASAWAVLVLIGGVIGSLIIGSLQPCGPLGFPFFGPKRQSRHREIRRLGTHLWHGHHLFYCHVDRRARRFWHCHLLDGTLSLCVAKANRNCDRTVGRNSIDHLRDLGPFRLAPFLQRNVQPGLISFFADIPVLSGLFAGPPTGLVS